MDYKYQNIIYYAFKNCVYAIQIVKYGNMQCMFKNNKICKIIIKHYYKSDKPTVSLGCWFYIFIYNKLKKKKMVNFCLSIIITIRQKERFSVFCWKPSIADNTQQLIIIYNNSKLDKLFVFIIEEHLSYNTVYTEIITMSIVPVFLVKNHNIYRINVKYIFISKYHNNNYLLNLLVGLNVYLVIDRLIVQNQKLFSFTGLNLWINISLIHINKI
ncbi:hypothetical protein AGLY_011920 [Aphis glycines]|uniref:Uncharacterized protein n=1 Tax=Aphis glycines TaxID=307491 RepID=A0A6G0TBH2_APHGL|nr:hypothetical protein AGLY_011920 [Aphis glycines]